MNYSEAKETAQTRANSLGIDHGIETRPDKTVSVFSLPRKENRCGYELRCEVVHPTNLDKCRPGHGPCA